jgi:ABC-type iron transport system FetAB ATPase subunit
MLSFPLVTESTNRSCSSRRQRRRSNEQPPLTGKSTLTKLLQMLYTPERGRILIDRIDITLLDPSWLRPQIGVVLQENVLFNRSIRDNIALADPTMPLEKVIAAAELAGAHEFILELPNGYDHVLEERGSNLFGGQRQRIAIARALLTNPRILIAGKIALARRNRARPRPGMNGPGTSITRSSRAYFALSTASQ